MSDNLMAVKFADGSDHIVEGLAIPFGGPFGGKDLDGEAFSADTDLALDWFPAEGRPVLYDHGLDEDVRTSLAGRQIEREQRDVGQWAKVQLDKRMRYFDVISEMVRRGELSFSSASVPHLVQTSKSGHIERWPWVELSLTPTPANPDARVYAVKMADAIEHIAAAKADVPDALKQAIDEWAGPEPDLPARIEAASAEVRHLVEQTRQHAAVRAVAKRSLSPASRGRLVQTLKALEGNEQARQELAELVRDTDPNRSVIEEQFLRFQRDRTRAMGVPI